MTAERERVVIFGAGEGGRRARRYFGASVLVVAHADNDPAKQGTRLDGVPIVSPAALAGLECDRIVIASIHEDAIRRQLLNTGIPWHRVEGIDRSVLMGDEEPPVGCWTALVALAALLVLLAWCLWP